MQGVFYLHLTFSRFTTSKCLAFVGGSRRMQPEISVVKWKQIVADQDIQSTKRKNSKRFPKIPFQDLGGTKRS